ncbi:hypothetical protein H5P30_14405 [Puniceicoccus vermicola]|uniref:Glycosidase n=2 Tax=Puniceicoccus vermicola TaxID=388746 RepID=A0A7X1AZW1_9BACT|nr:hypothetical protein [Puniceicoccus vermicola]
MDVPWADTMVLNPSIVELPGRSEIFMLFRACGAGGPEAEREGVSSYPIQLGSAYSEDGGQSWQADFSQPFLAPALATEEADMFCQSRAGAPVVNYSNGCIEDPRLFWLEGKCYLVTASRLFAPGAYWIKDDPVQCAPEWAVSGRHGLGRAASENLTVSVLYEIDRDAWIQKDYAAASRYVAAITDPERGDNRDVVIFPELVQIGDRHRYLSLHRPKQPELYGDAYDQIAPSIFMASAGCLEDLGTDKAEHRLLAEPIFDWEGDRIGASWTPIPIGDGEWLLPYHGKQDARIGYTQSFMILESCKDDWMRVKHRCPTRMMYASQDWELAGKFATPCLFTCGGIVRNGQLIMSYGAADTFAGVANVNLDELLNYIRAFNAEGQLFNDLESVVK